MNKSIAPDHAADPSADLDSHCADTAYSFLCSGKLFAARALVCKRAADQVNDRLDDVAYRVAIAAKLIDLCKLVRERIKQGNGDRLAWRRLTWRDFVDWESGAMADQAKSPDGQGQAQCSALMATGDFRTVAIRLPESCDGPPLWLADVRRSLNFA